MTIEQLIEKIKIKFGWPLIRMELTDEMIKSNIQQAIDKFIKHAVGQAKQETFFTFQVSGGVSLYNLPIPVVEVIDFEDLSTSFNHINTLFTTDNFLYQTGAFDAYLWPGSAGQFSMVNYQVAMDYIETIKRYMPSKYSWKYHYHLNQLELFPAPVFEDGSLVKYALLRCYTLEGTPLYATEKDFTYFYDKEWILRYSVALCKEVLGNVRNKFSSFQSIGNIGINLDGSQLKSEAEQEKETLLRELRDSEAWEGYGISIGTM